MSPDLQLNAVPLDSPHDGLAFDKEADDCFVFHLEQRTWRASYSRSTSSPNSNKASNGAAPAPRLLLDVMCADLESRDTVSQAAVIRLLPGSLQAVESWRSTMNSRLEEAIESIREEDVRVESWFLFHLAGQDYLFAYMQSASAPRAKADSSDLPIDAIHRDFKRVWDRSLRIPCERLPPVNRTPASST